MFTGIVTALGRVLGIQSGGDRLRITIAAPYPDLESGESIAVNGACLTVVEARDGTFSVDAIVTTRGRTTIGDLAVGHRVNLERALGVGDRLGGHFVQGHVDGVGEVVGIREEQDAFLVDVTVPPEVDMVSVVHGSITLDGVSLTVNARPAAGTLQVALIPYTRDHTTLGSWRLGTRVHVEGDVLGKFVKRFLEARDPGGGAEETDVVW